MLLLLLLTAWETRVGVNYYLCDDIKPLSRSLLLLLLSVPQTGPPRIQFSKRQFYIGENLVANCTTSRARPQPHITWLINGKKVNFRKLFPIIRGHVAAHSKSLSSVRGSISSHHPLE